MLKRHLATLACLGLLASGTSFAHLDGYGLVGFAQAKNGNGNGGNGGSGNGHSSSEHGKSEEAPGKSGTAPGKSGETPGKSGTAPGKSGETPGKSGTAPGKSGETPGKSGTAPGKSASNNAPKPEVSASNTLGAMNAAHASAQARKHANPKSAVGLVAAYDLLRQAALEIEDPVAREQALDDAETRLAADFGRAALSDEEIGKINALLDARQ